MTEALSATLANLVRLGKIDAQIAKQGAEKRRLLNLEGEIEKIIGSIKLELTDAERRLAEKKAAYEKEEKFLASEKQKLIERRKSLSSLGDYKLQSAAEREIEHSSRQLSKQEDRLVLQLDELEKLTTLRDEKAKVLEDKSQAGQRMLSEAMDRLSTIEADLHDLNTRRQHEATLVDRVVMQTYQRSFNRNPNDPVVSIKGSACGGCFINLGPQPLAEIANAQIIVTCRACGRILCSEPETEAAAE